jgi:hypothetical protein
MEYWLPTDEDMLELGYEKLDKDSSYWSNVPSTKSQYIKHMTSLLWDGNYVDSQYKPVITHIHIIGYSDTRKINGFFIWKGTWNSYCGRLKFDGDVESKEDFIKLLTMMHSI